MVGQPGGSTTLAFYAHAGKRFQRRPRHSALRHYACPVKIRQVLITFPLLLTLSQTDGF
ncbi:hypothetical protein KCP75_08130 [Salmonella enterica subsp. enterica]|nr:hypothetical protein KCP75_08130 [Salmonella enterica subsp. enterica]